MSSKFELRPGETVPFRSDVSNIQSLTNIFEGQGVVTNLRRIFRWVGKQFPAEQAEPRQTSQKKMLPMLLITACLAGCSSRPESGDIQKELSKVYDCPILELSDVKKVDGAENGKFYDVAFTHAVSIKGGADTAAKLFADWSRLDTGNQWDPVTLKILPQSCTAAAPLILLETMHAQADESFKTHPDRGPVPVSIKAQGQGRMAKTESGWHFIEMPALGTGEIVTANATYPRFKADVATSTNSTSEARRMVGKVRAGNTDSCLEVPVSGDSKCYTLPGESEVTTRIFSACQDGDMCAITGQFDDKNEKLIQFSKAEKVAP